MRIARPPEGFQIRLSKPVAAMVQAECGRDPGFEQYWGDVIERLKFTAHREGIVEPRLGRGYRLLAIEGFPQLGRPRLVLGNLAIGDTVSIRLLRIGQ